MKQCLITGGGSKFGKQLTNCLLGAGYHVHLITSSTEWNQTPNVTVIPVNWKSLSITDLKKLVPVVTKLDLIFFNHNASSLAHHNFRRGSIQSVNAWQQSYFVACQMPFYLIQLLSNKILPDTKIGWMLSNLITDPVESQVGFADYIGNKFTNACIMKSFSQTYPACFFGIHPDVVSDGDSLGDANKAHDIVNFISNSTTTTLNGKIFSAQGNVLTF